ncbi:YeiH family putative sulfate export transporter [Paludibacterium paludis]|uniref:Membrane protein n=1 Tax=Paludibacterium paludis TaxID=1225769 RepID=A0A918U9N8_9NEIS|nr:YeiH family putative sulfate export transporter [Paludibacterium paludis]GGY16846.1 membrane protein [Paludibacterium paludis]
MDRLRIRHTLPGLAAVLAIALGSLALAAQPGLSRHGVSALTLAIVIGMLAGNTGYPRVAGTLGDGVGLAKQTLLRLGIILYGLRLTFQDIAAVGPAGVATDALIVLSTFALALWVGIRWLGLDRDSAILIGAGSSICGAAAVLASEPVVKGGADKVSVAVATVVVFGTAGMFLYPLAYTMAHSAGLPVSARDFGLFAGSTLHEVAQVVAAARAVGDDAAGVAVIAKMMRVMMLAPFLIVLSATLSGKNTGRQRAITIPWFALGFVGMAGLNSLDLLPASVAAGLIWLDNLLLAMAMAALGLTTHVSSIRKAGIAPLILASVLFVWLMAGGMLINLAMQAML